MRSIQRELMVVVSHSSKRNLLFIVHSSLALVMKMMIHSFPSFLQYCRWCVVQYSTTWWYVDYAVLYVHTCRYSTFEIRAAPTQRAFTQSICYWRNATLYTTCRRLRPHTTGRSTNVRIQYSTYRYVTFICRAMYYRYYVSTLTLPVPVQ